MDRTRLIALVRERRELWDSLMPIRARRQISTAQWKEVAGITGLKVAECKRQFKTLRDGYRVQVRRMQSQCKSFSSWEHFYALDFMRPIYDPHHLVPTDPPMDDVNVVGDNLPVTSEHMDDIFTCTPLGLSEAEMEVIKQRIELDTYTLVKQENRDVDRDEAVAMPGICDPQQLVPIFVEMQLPMEDVDKASEHMDDLFNCTPLGLSEPEKEQIKQLIEQDTSTVVKQENNELSIDEDTRGVEATEEASLPNNEMHVLSPTNSQIFHSKTMPLESDLKREEDAESCVSFGIMPIDDSHIMVKNEPLSD